MFRLVISYTLLALSAFPSVFADEQELPQTLEALEGYEAENLVDEHAASGHVTPRTVMEQFNLHIEHKRIDCIKAIGHEKFCGCISENMPAEQGFANYVVAVSKTKEELNYNGLSDYYKHSIDLARSARDLCVSEAM